MNTNKLGIRLAMLRNELDMTQGDFAKVISEFANKERYFSPLTIAAWEQGQKTPSADVLVALATYYGVSSDWLLGLSEDRNGIMPSPVEKEENDGIKQIQRNKINITELPLYDGQPIYVVFRNHEYKDQWGILNYKEKLITMGKMKLTLNNACDYFSYDIPSYLMKRASTQALPYTALKTASIVWIEMKSYDISICSKYNGWYKHNEDHSALINALGLVLPYDGLGISYEAYSGN